MIKQLFITVLILCSVMGGKTLKANAYFNMDAQEVRKLINAKCMAIEAKTPEVSSVEELTIDAGGHKTPIRVYYPVEGNNYPSILLIHGGAWVAGNLDTHDNLARYFCKNVGAVVVSVGYENAPEGKFPLQLEQCYDALLWTKSTRSENSLAVVGDSAGGNMVATLCLMSRDLGGPKIDFQVLINPATDLSCQGTIDPQGDPLDFQRWQMRMYLVNPEDIYHPYVSPLLAKDLTHLPPALILLAELDDLRQEGQEYADKLQASKVPSQVYCQQGVNHLAGNAARASKTAIESLDIAVSKLREVLD